MGLVRSGVKKQVQAEYWARRKASFAYKFSEVWRVWLTGRKVLVRLGKVERREKTPQGDKDVVEWVVDVRRVLERADKKETYTIKGLSFGRVQLGELVDTLNMVNRGWDELVAKGDVK